MLTIRNTSREDRILPNGLAVRARGRAAIDAATWASMLEHPIVAEWVASGALVVERGEEPAPAEEPAPRRRRKAKDDGHAESVAEGDPEDAS